MRRKGLSGDGTSVRVVSLTSICTCDDTRLESWLRLGSGWKLATAKRGEQVSTHHKIWRTQCPEATEALGAVGTLRAHCPTPHDTQSLHIYRIDVLFERLSWDAVLTAHQSKKAHLVRYTLEFTAVVSWKSPGLQRRNLRRPISASGTTSPRNNSRKNVHFFCISCDKQLSAKVCHPLIPPQCHHPPPGTVSLNRVNCTYNLILICKQPFPRSMLIW